MEAAGVWKAPGRHPPTPGPSHTPWKSWAPAPLPPRIPTAPTAPATRSYILLGKTRKEATRRPLEPNTSRRLSLRSDEWSPSSEQVVAFVGIRILPRRALEHAWVSWGRGSTQSGCRLAAGGLAVRFRSRAHIFILCAVLIASCAFFTFWVLYFSKTLTNRSPARSICSPRDLSR